MLLLALALERKPWTDGLVRGARIVPPVSQDEDAKDNRDNDPPAPAMAGLPWTPGQIRSMRKRAAKGKPTRRWKLPWRRSDGEGSPSDEGS
jgi:hypothetical protein